MANMAGAHAHPLFSMNDQLNRDSRASLAIRHGIEDTEAEWNDCFASDLQTDILDQIYPHLWLVARKAGSHIDPLHKQVIKKRLILATENPKLHLVWYYGTIYIKPLPDYLLNHAIWQAFITPATGQPAQARARYDKHRAALGFLRSYGLLIRHESDFIIAQQANLLPKYVSFQRFQKFIKPFRSIHDDDVSHRYHYGQFRLTRLNWAVRIFRLLHTVSPVGSKSHLPWNYQEQLWQTTQRIQYYVTPLVFIFAILSLILSSMQVVLAALGDKTWDVFVQVSSGFSIATIIFAISPIIATIVGVLLLLIDQGQFALRAKWAEDHPRNDVEH